MPNIAVVGAQWGDEGKGKVVDLLCEKFDAVARFQGGPNAGHTVKFDGQTYALHHVPSGVFRPEARIVIGNGTVMDLAKLLEELDGLAGAGINLEGRLFISDRAHVVMSNPDMLHSAILPHHARWMRLFENLKYVVIDELHHYRGVFGSHLANVLRRLRRVCRFHGSTPVDICTITLP